MKRDDEGVAALELALVLPVFLALVLASIDFALVFRQQIMLRNAASNAASYAAVQPCDKTEMLAMAQQEISHVSVLQPTIETPLAPTYTDANGTATCQTATRVTVTVSAPYHLITGAVLGIFGVPQTLTVSGQETVQIQGRPA